MENKRNHRERARQKKKNTRGFYFIIFLGLVIMLPLIVLTSRQGKQLAELEKRAQELEQEKKALTEQLKKQEEMYNNLNTDEFIEKYAREKLGLVKPNELIYVKPDDEDQPEEQENGE